MKELRFFVLKCMSDELQRPSHQKKRQTINPQTMNEYGRDEYGERKQNCRDTQRMAYPVYRMPVAAGILRDPLFIGAAAEHGHPMIHVRTWKALGQRRVERPSASVLAS